MKNIRKGARYTHTERNLYRALLNEIQSSDEVFLHFLFYPLTHLWHRRQHFFNANYACGRMVLNMSARIKPSSCNFNEVYTWKSVFSFVLTLSKRNFIHEICVCREMGRLVLAFHWEFWPRHWVTNTIDSSSRWPTELVFFLHAHTTSGLLHYRENFVKSVKTVNEFKEPNGKPFCHCNKRNVIRHSESLTICNVTVIIFHCAAS